MSFEISDADLLATEPPFGLDSTLDANGYWTGPHGLRIYNLIKRREELQREVERRAAQVETGGSSPSTFRPVARGDLARLRRIEAEARTAPVWCEQCQDRAWVLTDHRDKDGRLTHTTSRRCDCMLRRIEAEKKKAARGRPSPPVASRLPD
jgi:hypothetical protein